MRDLDKEWTEVEILRFTDDWTPAQKSSLTRTLPRFMAKLELLRPPQRMSRTLAWQQATARAREALEDLIDLKGEFEQWRENLPENLEMSPVAEKLDAIIELDLDSAMDAISEAEAADLPRGFGQD